MDVVHGRSELAGESLVYLSMNMDGDILFFLWSEGLHLCALIPPLQSKAFEFGHRADD